MPVAVANGNPDPDAMAPLAGAQTRWSRLARLICTGNRIESRRPPESSLRGTHSFTFFDGLVGQVPKPMVINQVRRKRRNSHFSRMASTCRAACRAAGRPRNTLIGSNFPRKISTGSTSQDQDGWKPQERKKYKSKTPTGRSMAFTSCVSSAFKKEI